MKRTMLTLVAVLAACGQAEPTGGVQLALTGSVNETIYRLTGGTFVITGPSGASLATDADPEATTLEATLTVGDGYEIYLQPGWEVVREDGTPVDATLLTQNPTAFAVMPDATTPITFVFEVDEVPVVFETGGLTLDVDFVPPTVVGTCDPLEQAGCGAGQRCTARGQRTAIAVEWETVCAPDGTIPIGEACAFEPGSGLDDCVAGAVCGVDETGAGTCRRLCDRDAPPTGCDCTDINDLPAVLDQPFQEQGVDIGACAD